MGAAQMGEVLRGLYPRILRYYVPGDGFSVSRQIRVAERDGELIASIPHLIIRDPDRRFVPQRSVLSLSPFEAIAETDGDDIVLTYDGPLHGHLLWRAGNRGATVGINMDIGDGQGQHRLRWAGAEEISLDIDFSDIRVGTTLPALKEAGGHVDLVSVIGAHEEVAPGVIDGRSTIEVHGIRIGPEPLLDAIRAPEGESGPLEADLPLAIDRVRIESHVDKQHDDLLRAFPPFRFEVEQSDGAVPDVTADVTRALFNDPPLINGSSLLIRVERLRSAEGLALSSAELSVVFADGGTDAVDIILGFALEGLSAEFGWDDPDAGALMPETMSMSYGIRDIPGRSMMALAARIDAGEPMDFEQLTAAFDGSEMMIFIDDLEVSAPAYAITGFGQLIADRRSPNGFSGQAVFAMTGLDTLIQILADDPEQAELIGGLTLMQALGDRTAAAEDGSPLWSYSFVFQPDGSVTLNGSDITALIGSMVPA